MPTDPNNHNLTVKTEGYYEYSFGNIVRLRAFIRDRYGADSVAADRELMYALWYAFVAGSTDPVRVVITDEDMPALYIELRPKENIIKAYSPWTIAGRDALRTMFTTEG